MANPEAITRFPEPAYKLMQQSSYDRRSVHPDSTGWFANRDYTQFIREEQNYGRREFVMFEADGPGAVVRWWMTFGNVDALNSYVRVYMDDELAPLLEGRAPDLVGGGLIAPAPPSTSVSSLTESQIRGYNLYLPLPFRKRCKITLENDSIMIAPDRRRPSIFYNIGARLYNEGTKVVSLKKEMLLTDTLAISECASSLLENNESKGNNSGGPISGRYAPGASWNEYRNIETAGATSTGGTGNHFDISFVSLQGKGVYAGDGVVINNTVDAWWGEGDEKIYVDGETFPSSFGTGTEDYFGYAWGRPEPFSHPLISQPLGAGNLQSGVSVNMRYRNLDAIPFSKSIKSDIELWHWVKTTIDYSMVSYYYKLPKFL